MAQVDVVNLNGEKVGSVELADAVFGQINEALLWEAVKQIPSGNDRKKSKCKSKPQNTGTETNAQLEASG